MPSSKSLPEKSPSVESQAGYEFDIKYNMNHKRRGRFLVINNKTFSPALCGQGMGERRGTDTDAANLHHTFRRLGFEVEFKNNLTASDMLKCVSQEAQRDHSDADCFAMAVLSHGDDGIVYGTDEMIRIDNLIAPFKGNKCASLLGKPKLFFFQACRGTEFDEGAELPKPECEADAEKDCDDNDKTYTIPIEADFLYAYSTPPGHYAFRHAQKGAWFVQAITKVFKEFGNQLEINQLMIRVNRMVAYGFTSSSSNLEHCNKKQVSSIVSMLTKELYFTSKDEE